MAGWCQIGAALANCTREPVTLRHAVHKCANSLTYGEIMNERKEVKCVKLTSSIFCAAHCVCKCTNVKQTMTTTKQGGHMFYAN